MCDLKSFVEKFAGRNFPIKSTFVTNAMNSTIVGYHKDNPSGDTIHSVIVELEGGFYSKRTILDAHDMCIILTELKPNSRYTLLRADKKFCSLINIESCDTDIRLFLKYHDILTEILTLIRSKMNEARNNDGDTGIRKKHLR